ncbi:KAT8 regulatory NSL complex subunit 2 [Eumeta japonica]|uniref:KAT8 regulatory NSL complex subunit 2 n=1 Tax=Eumeta variegata TaxID=151549 RepID=A0A4C1ZC79_EUMVA|nr:KAT8 regulatory NSL complex subunit 2 [Eumeta japonica]
MLGPLVLTISNHSNDEHLILFQLHKEIKWRSRVCAHRGYECTLPVVCGREYCPRHILEDPTAPYKQCLHTYSNGERCPLPAPAPQNTVHDNRKDQGLCFEHARAAMSARQRSGAPPPPVTTVETILHQLQHYVRPERPRTTSCASAVSVVSDPDDGPAPHPLDPFS